MTGAPSDRGKSHTGAEPDTNWMALKRAPPGLPPRMRDDATHTTLKRNQSEYRTVRNGQQLSEA